MVSTQRKLAKCIALLTIVALLFAVLGISAYAGSSKGKFRDVEDSHWASKQIADMVDRGILKGYSDGTFRPSAIISRAEFACIMIKAAGITPANSETQTFADVKPGDWFYPYVEGAKSYLTGFRNSKGQLVYFPNTPAVREDIAVAIVKLMGYDVSNVDLSSLEQSFKDYKKISEALRKYIAVAVENNLMSGYPDGTFRPTGKLTRAEASMLLYKVLNKEEDATKVVLEDTELGTGENSEGYNTSDENIYGDSSENPYNEGFGKPEGMNGIDEEEGGEGPPPDNNIIKEVIVNGETVQFDNNPIFIRGELFVSVKMLKDLLKVETNWMGVTAQLIIIKGPNKLIVSPKRPDYIFNGKPGMHKIMIIVKDGKLMVPLRLISKIFRNEIKIMLKANKVVIDLELYDDQMQGDDFSEGFIEDESGGDPEDEITEEPGDGIINSPEEEFVKKIIVDGIDVTGDYKLLIRGRDVFSPLRLLSLRQFGFRVNYDAATKGIVFVKDGRSLKLFMDSNTAIVGTNRINMPYEPFILNGQTYIPLQFVVERFGFSFRLDYESKTVTITNVQSNMNIPEENIDEPYTEEDTLIEDEVIEDEVIEDEVIEDEVIEDEIIEDEVIEDEVIEDEVIEDEVIEDEVIEDEVIEDEVIEDDVPDDGVRDESDSSAAQVE